MTGGTAPDIPPEELDRIEELVRYLAEHDGRMPTDDLPLAWWLVGAVDLEQDHPVRRALAGIPVHTLDRNLTPKKAHAWNLWVQRYDQVMWISRRGGDLDGALAKDKTLRDWYNDMLSRHHVGSLGTVETLLLGRNPLWDSERLPDTRSSKGQMAFKVGINAVREFYLQNKHSEIPEGYTVAGLDVHQWWHTQRSRYASDSGMKEHLRQQFTRLGKLGVDLRTDKQRAQDDIVFRFRDRLREIADFIGEHGMSALPERGEPFVNRARIWIDQYRKGTLDPALQEALEGIDGWSWEACGEAEEARKRAEWEERRRQLAEQRGTEHIGPVLDAIRAFAEQYGHTGIPVGAVTEDGVPFGRLADRWRRQEKVDRKLRRHLEEIPGWMWLRTPASPNIQRPAPVAIPEDTTQMNRAGLRQFLPAD